mmetsp:Transcript_33615/g.79283  ORF Transcript_33615/g.79283 Transcript_33615/m.79283 type:complete len:153 (+) Transcript_33615:231-689(+)|eukprot:CAMPEP_0172383080 /NCGR_PEP_ID=MMETSP1061-20121228/1012_1 /TAXON_ID=37318 /ORGANISM="Pseudo-nitzschia pungens, Strain cf. pungens" /LENGTH=152 /DNA_ID=CAMNT_0013111207 /DNA_START=198 /DNA_END=656 /DNA_ORIENTATION=-
MASAAIQAQANALNARMEGEASKMLDAIERQWMRKVARQSFACAVGCYDKAGTSGPAESLESCTRNCQAPYQQSSNLIQQEVAQFQNRLNRNMQECQEKARDMISPGMEQDARAVSRVENALIKCMEQQVNDHIQLLQPMKDRITSVLKHYQ